MRIAIRADASTSIGTGHVMRQIALAQHLLSEHHEVTLFASITGPDWLRKYVESQSGLVWVEVEEGDFSEDPLLAGGAVDALVVDAYALKQNALQLLEKALPSVAVIVDGPWQDVSGKLAIAPTLDRNPSWVPGYQNRFGQFHWGPEFFMLRREALELRKKRAERRPSPETQIVVALGGSDIGGKTERIVEILARAFPAAAIDAYVPEPVGVAAVDTTVTGKVTLHGSGPGFLDTLAMADFAVVGAGTTVAEAIFIETPAIFVVVADNQMGNHGFLKNTKIGLSLVLDSPTFEPELGHLLRVQLGDLSRGDSRLKARTTRLLDGKGVDRVSRLIAAPIERRAGV